MAEYVGFDGYASGKRKGTEEFARQFIKATGGAFFHNGSYGRRAARGKAYPSVHGTGRAIDLSYRGAPTHAGCGDRKVALEWIDWLVEHANELGVAMIIDYAHKPFGRAWRTDRQCWRVYMKPTVGGGGKSWADWIHVEITHLDGWADDADAYKQVFASILGEEQPVIPTPPRRVIVPYGGTAIRRGHKDTNLVMKIQRVVGAKQDGLFGPKTEKAGMAWQGKNGLLPDGIIGPKTWAVLGPLL